MCCDNISSLIVYHLLITHLSFSFAQHSVAWTITLFVSVLKNSSLSLISAIWWEDISLMAAFTPLLATHLSHLVSPFNCFFVSCTKWWKASFLSPKARIIIFPKQGFNCKLKVLLHCSWTLILCLSPNQHEVNSLSLLLSVSHFLISKVFSSLP